MAFLEYRPTKTLHQFCSFESLRGILSSNTIWCTDLSSANDPRELRLGFQHFLEALKFVSETKYKGSVSTHLGNLASRLMSGTARQQIFCACFSLLGDSLPMWREYADGGNGVAIGFRPGAITSLPGRIQKVNYLSADTPDEFRKLIDSFVESFDPNRSASDLTYWTTATSSILAAASALKHHTWEHEHEVRFGYAQVYINPGSSNPISAFDDGTPIYWQTPLTRTRNSEQVQYLAFPFGLRRSNDYKTEKAIERVILGPRCEFSVEQVKAELSKHGFVADVVKSECQIR